jgi:hypothetical protein
MFLHAFFFNFFRQFVFGKIELWIAVGSIALFNQARYVLKCIVGWISGPNSNRCSFCLMIKVLLR